MNGPCQQLIVEHHKWVNGSTPQPHPLPCVFGDVLACVPESVDFVTGTFSVKRRRLSNEQLKKEQYCVIHDRECPLDTAVDFDFSGLPCPDNSKANHKRRFEEGPTGTVFITYAKMHLDAKTPLLCIENVPESGIGEWVFLNLAWISQKLENVPI